MLQPIDLSKPNPARELHDQILAAMETGNQSRARERLAALRDVSAQHYQTVRMEVMKDYGVAL